MATSCAWVSVVVKCGPTVLYPRTIVKCSWDDKFGSLLTRVGGMDMEGRTLTKIAISRTEKFTDPVHVVPPDAPIILCEQFNCFYACLTISPDTMNSESSQPMHSKNAFDVLMASSYERVLPRVVEPNEGKELRSDQHLYNNILGVSNSHTSTCIHIMVHTHT